MSSLSNDLINWHKQSGRKNLPWQVKTNPYKVWISEIMLQQTQVKTVIPYFLKFVERYPNINSLANSDEDEVLSYWSGLGYYSRGRNLLKSAKILKPCSPVFPKLLISKLIVVLLPIPEYIVFSV